MQLSNCKPEDQGRGSTGRLNDLPKWRGGEGAKRAEAAARRVAFLVKCVHFEDFYLLHAEQHLNCNRFMRTDERSEQRAVKSEQLKDI